MVWEVLLTLSLRILIEISNIAPYPAILPLGSPYAESWEWHDLLLPSPFDPSNKEQVIIFGHAS